MNVQKCFAIAAALLITFVGFVGIANYSSASAAIANTQDAVIATHAITTLPTIHVSPTAEQLREARGE